MVGSEEVKGFEKLSDVVEKEIKGFLGLYKAYCGDAVSYEDVLRYIDENDNLRRLFLRYIAEEIEINIAKHGLINLVDHNGAFVPYWKMVDETIDRFVEWLRLHRYI